MKKNPSLFSSSRGFTLVELLVVIVIVATLAAVSFTLGPKMMKRGDAAKSLQNMRQIGSLVMTYAVDNSNRLPAPRADVSNGNGGFTQLHWHETLLALAYPDTEPAKLLDTQWWLTNKPFLRNPLCTEKTKPWPWASWNPGYAMNLQIAEQLGQSSGDWSAGKGGPQAYGTPVSSISDTARTPLIAPRGDWHYTYTPSQVKDKDLQEFLVDGKMPILFVDGHVETMRLEEYVDRNLYLAPTFKGK